MEMLNIKHGNQVQQLWYDYNPETGIFSFENDIQIGTWSVSRLIKLGGPREGSVYKYDFRNFLEFVITDINGDSQVLTWNHNAGDKVLKAHWGDSTEEALLFFFEKHPVFSAADWEDYKYIPVLKAIKKIIEDDCPAKETITKISQLISTKKLAKKSSS